MTMGLDNPRALPGAGGGSFEWSEERARRVFAGAVAAHGRRRARRQRATTLGTLGAVAMTAASVETEDCRASAPRWPVGATP